MIGCAFLNYRKSCNRTSARHTPNERSSYCVVSCKDSTIERILSQETSAVRLGSSLRFPDLTATARDSPLSTHVHPPGARERPALFFLLRNGCAILIPPELLVSVFHRNSNGTTQPVLPLQIGVTCKLGVCCLRQIPSPKPRWCEKHGQGAVIFFFMVPGLTSTRCRPGVRLSVVSGLVEPRERLTTPRPSRRRKCINGSNFWVWYLPCVKGHHLIRTSILWRAVDNSPKV